jgi:hypothetical protein
MPGVVKYYVRKEFVIEFSTIMYKNSQTANNVFRPTLFNPEVKLPVSVRMQDHHQVFTS